MSCSNCGRKTKTPTLIKAINFIQPLDLDKDDFEEERQKVRKAFFENVRRDEAENLEFGEILMCEVCMDKVSQPMRETMPK